MKNIPFAGLQGTAVAVASLGDAAEEGADSQAMLLQIAAQYAQGWSSWGDLVLHKPDPDEGAEPAVSSSRARSPAPSPADEVEFIVEADDQVTRSKAPGIAYRNTKRLFDRDPDKELAEWGSLVSGVDRGDDWLRVGDHYLPMSIDGVAVVHPRKPPVEEVPEEEELEEDPSADPVDNLFRRAERKVKHAERAHEELAARTRQALHSSATWCRHNPGGASVEAIAVVALDEDEEEGWG